MEINVVDGTTGDGQMIQDIINIFITLIMYPFDILFYNIDRCIEIMVNVLKIPSDIIYQAVYLLYQILAFVTTIVLTMLSTFVYDVWIDIIIIQLAIMVIFVVLGLIKRAPVA